MQQTYTLKTAQVNLHEKAGKLPGAHMQCACGLPAVPAVPDNFTRYRRYMEGLLAVYLWVT